MFERDPDAPNVVPTRYRQVALATNLESLDPDWLTRHFTGREAYMKTRFIVARHGDETALVEVARPQRPELFSPIEAVRVLAGGRQCRYVVAPDVDTAVASQMAEVAMTHRDASCIVVEGRYSHVSFILNPQPLVLRVLDIVPPFPSKLVDQVRRVLDAAEDLPPVVVEPVLFDSRETLAEEPGARPDRVLVPCRGSGVTFDDATVSYLDERPARADWTLLGCERSQRIHSWFYGGPAPLVDICPHRFLDRDHELAARTLTRCCLIQEGIETHRRATIVPWGATLREVRAAIEVVIAKTGLTWTRT